MEKGGNKKCQEFFEKSPEFHDAMTIGERYSSEFAEDYKEKLTADVEGKPWTKTPRALKPKPKSAPTASATPRSNTPLSSNASQKERNEAYFARLGSANESRPDHVPPSQGGKYTGFGSTPPPGSSNGGSALEDLTRDPVAALTKGWGFFTSQATRAAQIANEQVLKPTAAKLAEADLSKTAGYVQGVGRLGYENFSKFVEGPNATGRSRVEPENKDFWESFGEPAAATTAPPKPSALGTSAVKKPTGYSSANIANAVAPAKKEDDDWGNDDWDKF